MTNAQIKPSQGNPFYTAILISAQTGSKYYLTPIITSISLSDTKGQLAQCAKITIANILVGKSYMSGIVRGRDRLFVYANDGQKSDEVFRGFVWSRPYKSDLEKNLTIIAYDNLIYMQESEESQYFEKGKSTKDVISSIFSEWGVPCDYQYESITHEKLPLRGTLSNIILEELLEKVKDRTGKSYTIRSKQDKVSIFTSGTGGTVYNLKRKSNVLYTESEFTMDGVVTKVKILGKAGDDERVPVEAVVSKNTELYGTLQKLIDKDENTSLADAKKEANELLDKNSAPKWTYSVAAVDIPWIRKGDVVNLEAGDLIGKFVVLGVIHDITNDDKNMMIEMERMT